MTKRAIRMADEILTIRNHILKSHTPVYKWIMTSKFELDSEEKKFIEEYGFKMEYIKAEPQSYYQILITSK